MNINIVGPTFSYTLPFDLYALQPLKNDEDLTNMFQFSDRCARVYICLASTVEDDETIENGGQGLNETIVGSNSPVPYSTRDVDIRMQSRGFHQRCAESHVGPLESSHFESAILGSGHTFSTANEFRDAIYLMSVGCRFRYKFKRNCLKHMTVICVVEGCPWKVTARAVGRTKIVQVHTFRNEHNHSLEDVSIFEPVVHCNRATTMIDDVIRSNPDYLPRQICKDFRRQYGMQLNYCQAWNLKEKAKERIHEKLKMVIGERDVIIISDRHQGIIRSVSEVFGSENHAHCYRHIKENFSSFVTKLNTKGRKGKENALQMLDSIAYARLDCDYEVAMDTLRTFNHDLAKWVEENNPQHWAISKFKKMHWDKMTSNLAESFNSWLRHERHHNICVFFIEHMDKLGSLLVEDKNGLVKWNGCIGPKTEEKTALNIGKAIRRMGFDVPDYVDDWYKYNLQEKIIL
ncbi:hypothetical protein CK203_046270 [Vitis vinifera]|uniref:Transposase MuDR plant domain-containing protein n=1 Tax=Vitis vinifera TaxID=29760 RepID=A0A438HDG6_VITVI|nr:hypothetical protein CK203_046270 [Vitis vinifera]